MPELWFGRWDSPLEKQMNQRPAGSLASSYTFTALFCAFGLKNIFVYILKFKKLIYEIGYLR
jgi:hypothetical protein